MSEGTITERLDAAIDRLRRHGQDHLAEGLDRVDEAGLAQWSDIDRLDVRPEQGVIKVRGKNRWEVQVDAATAEVLHVQYRRSDLIESLHDGSWFGDFAHDRVMPLVACLLLFLAGSGYVMWAVPKWRKWRKRRAA